MGNWFSSSNDAQQESASEEEVSPRSKFATPSVSSRSSTMDASTSEKNSSAGGSGGMRKIEKKPNPTRGFRGGSSHSVLK